MRLITRLAMMVLLAACGGAGAGDGDEVAVRPSVLLVIADDLGVHDTGAYGHGAVSTPHVDALAREGLRFDAAYTVVPECTPSRTTLYTGLNPEATGVTRNDDGDGRGVLRPGIVTLPRLLADDGYAVALSGKAHVEPVEAFAFQHLGLDDVDGFLAGLGDQPFFLVVALRDPHRPYPLPPRTDPDGVVVPASLVDTDQTRVALAGYYDRIAAMDATLGTCLDSLARHGLADETLVLFTSDHGAALPFAKWTLYEAGVAVPLLARWPGIIEPGTSTDALVTFADVAPTLLELCGVASPSPMDGSSFADVLLGRAQVHAEAVFTQFDTRDGGAQRALRTGRDKLIVNLPPRAMTNRLAPGQPLGAMVESWIATGDPRALERAADVSERPPVELYDLIADPYELNNLVADPSRAADLAALRERLAARFAAAGDPRAAEIASGD